MKCKKCGYTYQEGDKFCGGCGMNLAESYDATNSEEKSVKEKSFLDKCKVAAKSYCAYFLSVFKTPLKTIEKVDRKQVGNSVFTLCLFSLFIPLTIYCVLKENVRQFFWYTIEIDFTDTVVKPFFIIAIILVLLITTIYLTVKLSKTVIHFLDVLSKFGALLLLPTVLLFIGLLFVFIGAYELMSIIDSIALMGVSISIPLLIYSIKKEDQTGLDAFYCILISYIILFILLVVVGEGLLENIYESINIFNY